MMMNRRGLLLGATATFLCAPAIVRASSLMALNPKLGLTPTSKHTIDFFYKTAALESRVKSISILLPSHQDLPAFVARELHYHFEQRRMPRPSFMTISNFDGKGMTLDMDLS